MQKILIVFMFLVSLSTSFAEQINKDLIMDIQLDNFLYYKSDSDFDSSKRLYQPQGESEGILGSYLNAHLTLNITEDVYIFYELELGSNIWSKNNPDIIDPISTDIFILKHRQIYGYAELFDLVRLKSGYMRLIDPTGLFINHWIGAFELGLDIKNTKNTIIISQMPDFNYEGFTVSTNNFANDRWVFALSSSFNLFSEDIFTLGWFTLYDDTVIRRSNLLHSPLISYTMSKDPLRITLDAMLQFGVHQNASFNNEDVKELSYGLNLNLFYKFTDFAFTINGLYLGADDKYNDNKVNGGFYYSGKNRSATLILSENELRDQYNNIDERLSVETGQFYIMRAGLILTDVKLDYNGFNFLTPSIVVGSAFVANDENALGSYFVGFESDLILKMDIGRGWSIEGAVGLLIPGRAASAFVNMYDLNKTEPIYMGEAHIKYIY